MLLKKVSIHKYKSFVTEQQFEVERGITRIVGKNESGKTALLEVLAKSNYFEPNSSYKFDKTLDYPRSELARSSSDPKVVTCEYYIDDELWTVLEEELGVGILSSRSFKITKTYNNTIISEFNPDFNKFKKFIIKKYEISKEKGSLIENCNVFDELLKASQEDDSLKDVFELLKIITNELSSFVDKWDNTINQYIYNHYLSPKLPKFWYFSDYYNMPSMVNISSFINNNNDQFLSSEEYNIVKALFDLSGLKAKNIQDESNFESFIAQIESTSNSITDQMFEYWTTNENLEIRFEIEHATNGNRYLNIRVYNQKHRVTLPLKNRSRGFIWFFSFLVWFSKIQSKTDTDYILLLDEPGLSLHASAQKDLLRFIEERLAPNYQVLYTTHSPFMIDSLKLNEVRTVYDSQDRNTGSIISDALEEKDSDTLFPLQAALGYTIAQNLYVSKKNLLVEGISDLVYLNYFSSLLKSMGRIGLHDDITIVPVGGADKIATFISLMRGNDLGIVCLLDTFTDQSAQARLEGMVVQKIIQRKRIIFYHDILQSRFADVEDFFLHKEYLHLYNEAFSKSIMIEDIDESKPVMSQLTKLNNNKKFNHYLPANYMVKNIADLTFSEETLDHFEDVFKKVDYLFK